MLIQGFIDWLSGKESACDTGAMGDAVSVPGPGRSSGGGHGNALQCSGLQNPRDTGAWWATAHEVAKRVRQDLVTKQHINLYTFVRHLLSAGTNVCSSVKLPQIPMKNKVLTLQSFRSTSNHPLSSPPIQPPLAGSLHSPRDL